MMQVRAVSRFAHMLAHTIMLVIALGSGLASLSATAAAPVAPGSPGSMTAQDCDDDGIPDVLDPDDGCGNNVPQPSDPAGGGDSDGDGIRDSLDPELPPRQGAPQPRLPVSGGGGGIAITALPSTGVAGTSSHAGGGILGVGLAGAAVVVAGVSLLLAVRQAQVSLRRG